MNWITKFWVIYVLNCPTYDVDFNDFRKWELVEMMNRIRLMFLSGKFKVVDDEEI